MNATESVELFRKIRRGDTHAFRKLFDRWYTPLCRHAVTFVGDQQVAEDIVQELFINLWTNRESIDITGSVQSYLYRSIRNRCLNYLRDHKAAQNYERDYDRQVIEDPENDDDEVMRQLHGFALEAIRRLPERCRVIFNYSRHTGLTNREIAQKLKISEKTVENQITIALRKLRDKLEPYLEKILVFIIIFYNSGFFY